MGMFDSILGSLGGPLMGMLGGGGNTRASGGSGGSVQNSNPLNSIFQTFAPMIKPLAGAAGTALGTYFGGPLGGMLGGSLGDTVGGMFGGNGQPQQQQPQTATGPQQFGPQQSYGNQFGTSFGNAMNQGFNQYIPQQLQGQNFSNMGGALGGYLGGQFGHPNFGTAVGNMFNPYIQSRMPESMRNEKIGNFGGYLGSQAGQRFDEGMQGIQNRFNPSAGGYRGRMSTASSFAPIQGSYGNIPEAPPFDLDMGNQGGSSYGNIPEAPPFDLDMNQGQPNMNQSGYGNIPEAPPFDLNMGSGSVQRPSSRPGLEQTRMNPSQLSQNDRLMQEIRNHKFSPKPNGNRLPPVSPNFNSVGGFKRPPSTPAEEFNQRISGLPNNGIRSGAQLGLRSSQTRASDAFPTTKTPHDNLMNEVRNYRRPVPMDDYKYQRGNYA